jgi:hypothetical protein
MYWCNPEGETEPWQTGHSRYDTKEEAIVEAQAWAKAQELEYVEQTSLIRVAFKALFKSSHEWQDVYVDVRNEQHLKELQTSVDGVFRIEEEMRFKETNKLTGPSIDFCLTKNCKVCGGRS